MFVQVSRTNITANCTDNTTWISYMKLLMKSRQHKLIEQRSTFKMTHLTHEIYHSNQHNGSYFTEMFSSPQAHLLTSTVFTKPNKNQKTQKKTAK